jgi:ABC-type multidrug transport system ATPase subunit
MIEATSLTKWYGKTLAVNDLSFTVEPGKVTGFLGPNGAGKATTIRMILGLDNPTSGDVRIDGMRYHELKHPLRKIGALLDAKWVRPNRSARAHLKWMAVSNKIPVDRVDEVLDTVGLSSVAGKRAGGFSLGMSNASASPGRCSVIPKRCCSTSRSTVWIPRASSGSASSCTGWPTRAGQCSCRATCCPRWR